MDCKSTSAKRRHTFKLCDCWACDKQYALVSLSDFFKDKHFYCAKEKLDIGKQYEYITAIKIQKRNAIKNEGKQLKQAQEFLKKHKQVFFCYLSSLQK